MKYRCVPGGARRLAGGAMAPPPRSEGDKRRQGRRGRKASDASAATLLFGNLVSIMSIHSIWFV